MSDFPQFQPVNPMASFGQGFNIGQAIQQKQLEEQARQQAEAARIAEAERQKQYQGLFNTAMNPNATANDWVKLIASTPADQIEPIKAAYAALPVEAQKNAITQTVQVISAIRSDNIPIATAYLQDMAMASRNDGDENGAKMLENQIKRLEAGGDAAETVLSELMFTLTATEPGQETLDSIMSITSDAREAQKQAFEQQIAERETDVLEAGQELDVDKFDLTQSVEAFSQNMQKQKFGLDKLGYNLDVEAQKLDQQAQALNVRRQNYAELSGDQQYALDLEAQELNQQAQDLAERKLNFEERNERHRQQLAILDAGQAIEATDEEIMKFQATAEAMGDDIVLDALNYASALREDGAPVTPMTANQRAQLAATMNERWYNRTKNVNEALDSYANLSDLASKGTGEADYALIKAFNILLEPGSVVREGEFAMTEQTEAMINNMIKDAQNVVSSEGRVRLTPEQRERFVDASEILFGTVSERRDAVKDGIDGFIQLYGLSPTAVYGPNVVKEYQNRSYTTPAGFDDAEDL